jgi:hypothetical protein
MHIFVIVQVFECKIFYFFDISVNYIKLMFYLNIIINKKGYINVYIFYIKEMYIII